MQAGAPAPRAANVRLFRLAAEILRAIEAGVFVPNRPLGDARPAADDREHYAGRERPTGTRHDPAGREGGPRLDKARATPGGRGEARAEVLDGPYTTRSNRAMS